MLFDRNRLNPAKAIGGNIKKEDQSSVSVRREIDEEKGGRLMGPRVGASPG